MKASKGNKDSRRMKIGLKALKITVTYFIFGCLWIIISDIAADLIFTESGDIFAVNIIKGLFYVLSTALLIFFLVNSAFQKLKKNEDKLRKSQRIAKAGSWEMKPGSTVISGSDMFFELLGLEKKESFVQIDEIEKMIVEEDRNSFKQNLSDLLSGKTRETEMQYGIKTKQSDEKKYFHCIMKSEIDKNGNLRMIASVIADITKTRKLEMERDQLREQAWNQQKLESIGTLASGVAHEINNPINGILNYGQLILDSTEADSENNSYAKEIIYETNRVTKIVRNLLDFSRKADVEPRSASIESIIENTLSLIKTIFKHDNIAIDILVEKDLPECVCRDQRIQQVLMNLLTNAKDSLNEKYPGYHEDKKIDIECKRLNEQDKDYVSITVMDFGTGIPDEIKNRIFDPFFTTKGRSSGTGLGLSISYGIVKEHGGLLDFDSKIGEYTKFRILLPY